MKWEEGEGLLPATKNNHGQTVALLVCVKEQRHDGSLGGCHASARSHGTASVNDKQDEAAYPFLPYLLAPVLSADDYSVPAGGYAA
jgi:hypothetical protein